MVDIYTFDLEFKLVGERISLPKFKGGLIRGILGHALKDVIKDSFPFQQQEDIYNYLWSGKLIEKDHLPERYRKFSNLPLSFSIIPPDGSKQNYDVGEGFSFKFIIIGTGIYFFKIWLKTFLHISSYAPDFRSKGRLILNSITLPGGEMVDSFDYLENMDSVGFKTDSIDLVEKSSLIFKLITPLRLSRDSRKLITMINSNIFNHQIIERYNLYNLNYLEDNSGFTLLMKKQYLDVVDMDVKINDRIFHSTKRQKSKIETFGVEGSVKVNILDSNIFNPLKIISKMGLGQLTSSGFGRIEFE